MISFCFSPTFPSTRFSLIFPFISFTLLRFQAQAALMYDAVFVLVEAFNKLLRKKPDQFRSYTMRRSAIRSLSSSSIAINSSSSTVLQHHQQHQQSHQPYGNNFDANGNGISTSNAGSTSNNNGRALDCNMSKGWVIPWEHGDKISQYLRKVSWFFFVLFHLFADTHPLCQLVSVIFGSTATPSFVRCQPFPVFILVPLILRCVHGHAPLAALEIFTTAYFAWSHFAYSLFFYYYYVDIWMESKSESDESIE